MKANAVSLLGIFEQKQRLEVPLFQRQYVWDEERQWEPLWEDISRKFSEHLEGRVDAPVHFLGAMVLDQKQTPTTHVIKRQVIDGQQRLTTLQIFLAAFRDFARANDCEEIAKECETYTANKGMMADPDVDKFKVWPTTADRKQFSDVIVSGSTEELNRRHPRVRQKYAREFDPRPRMVEAYLFFYRSLREFFLELDGTDETQEDLPLRLETSFHALKEALQVVVIDLDAGDDAQVIFETLNARGEPLLPADLLRNYIFLRAARKQEDQETLYSKYWQPFDEPFWRVEIRQGRLSRPRSDLFMQHFLASRQHVDVPVKHLYVEYRHWIEKQQPFADVESELRTLASQRQHFRRLLTASDPDPLTRLSGFLSKFDVSTVYPVVLWFMASERTDDEIRALGLLLESYLVRRAVCGLTAKNYNRLFLRGLASIFKREANEVEAIQSYLLQLDGESSEWPDDRKFAEAWLNANLYTRLTQNRLVYVLSRISSEMHKPGGESISIENDLTIEHLLPQEWISNWPLRDGTQGVSWMERWELEDDDPKKIATEERERRLQTIGNLTIITQPLNSSVSNGPWNEKRPELMKVSLLPINQMLHSFEIWDEASIEQRARTLFEHAVRIWPHPRHS